MSTRVAQFEGNNHIQSRSQKGPPWSIVTQIRVVVMPRP